MARRTKTAKKSAPDEGAARRVNGNGHESNGNGRANGSGNGAAGITRKLIAKAEAQLDGNGHANGKGNGTATAEDPRRVAAEIGKALLVATSIETARHSDDVELITGALCDELDISGHERDDVLAAARLHDIGKASIPREIVEKPRPLDPDEWELMRQHTVVGEQILASVKELKEIARIVRYSHERWDGLGYPDGLPGEEIPLGSRIIFCADAFHAMRCDRPYRPGRTAAAALSEIKSCSGSQFDPQVVSTLEAVVRELRIVRPRGKSVRSSRLAALLLVLAFGGGGSAIARTDVLPPAPAAPGSAPEVAAGTPLTCDDAECASMFDATLLEQMRELGLVIPKELGLPLALGLTSPGATEGSSGDLGKGNAEAGGKGPGGGSGEGDSGGNGSGNQGESAGGGQGSGGSPGNSGSSPGNSGSAPGRGSSGSPGNSGAAGSSGKGNSGGSGKGGGNDGGGSPGNSGSAPAHSASAPGNSGSAPSSSGSAPGQQAGSPGNSGSAPGHNQA